MKILEINVISRTWNNQHAIKYINAPCIFAGREKTILFSPETICFKWREQMSSLRKISGVVPTSDTTVMNYIVFYLNNIFQIFGHRELVVLVEDGNREFEHIFISNSWGNCACVINITSHLTCTWSETIRSWQNMHRNASGPNFKFSEYLWKGVWRE